MNTTIEVLYRTYLDGDCDDVIEVARLYLINALIKLYHAGLSIDYELEMQNIQRIISTGGVNGKQE